MDDLINRQAVNDAAIDAADDWDGGYSLSRADMIERAINNLPSAQPEQLTDKEQRIFLAAMGREEKVCKQVDEECKDCREPYEDIQAAEMAAEDMPDNEDIPFC